MKKCFVVMITALMLLLIPSFAYAEETFTFTEDELYEYVFEQVHDDPSAYDVVTEEEYERLQQDIEHSKEQAETSAPTGGVDKYDVFMVILGVVAIAYISYRMGIKKR